MKAHQSFRHEALLYRSPAEFLEAVVPFVMDGIELQQPTVVGVVESRARLIRDAIGSAAQHVTFVDITEVAGNPGRIVAAWHQFIAANGNGGQALRAVGEPIWRGRSHAEVVECQLNEGLLNLAIPPDTPLWLICPYDVTALDGDVTANALQSHPVILDQGGYRGSTSYGGAYYVQDLFQRPLPEPVPTTEAHGFGRTELGDVANRVLSAAFRAGLPVAQSQNLAAAIRELAADAAEAGSGSATARMWCADGAFICEITDTQTVSDPIVGRLPVATRAARKGLWRANQTSDLLQMRSNDSGTTVRVHTWL